MLTQERLKELVNYDPDTGIFTTKRPGYFKNFQVPMGVKDKRGYERLCVDCSTVAAHRAAWLYMTGKLPADGMQIDHIDRNRSNNRFSNLREVTPKRNSENRGISSNNTSGFKGVSWSAARRKWVASIGNAPEGVLRLGGFDTAAEASLAYESARKLLHDIPANL